MEKSSLHFCPLFHSRYDGNDGSVFPSFSKLRYLRLIRQISSISIKMALTRCVEPPCTYISAMLFLVCVFSYQKYSLLSKKPNFRYSGKGLPSWEGNGESRRRSDVTSNELDEDGILALTLRTSSFVIGIGPAKTPER